MKRESQNEADRAWFEHVEREIDREAATEERRQEIAREHAYRVSPILRQPKAGT